MDIFVNLDRNGRMTLPSKIRKQYKTNKFIVEDRKKEILLKPIMSMEKLFGSLPDLDIEKLKKEHLLEVRNETID